ncbi:hypothetical protein H257_16741 [Aphanomyces astaci]|uniref:Uncharacterized protein n=1 Tax=Aphanomyces astaci TaxID=112090 RepID=W4FJL6_APHAT|nr:hypothetical protein H257_16741 [Aphanomyces astaci]ETV66938.1 hypothetical protein H257_16741 [Aphanomyces astaci]|eukprot:XP_009843579.1 hypothetical protein H257_16741 [Aphanomyces astaci]
MAGEGSSSWPPGWPSSLEEGVSTTRRSREGEEDAATRSTSPFRRPSSTMSSPSTSGGVGDVLSKRRFKLHEPDEMILHLQRHQEKLRWRQQLDEQVQEKTMLKAKEDDEKRIKEEDQAQRERQYQRQQHLRAQQKLGHVSALPNPPRQQQTYVSSGGTTSAASIHTPLPPSTTHVNPPPVPYSSPSRGGGGSMSRNDPNNSPDVISQMQAMLDELRLERVQIQLERQQMQLERDAMIRERQQLDHERDLLARDRGMVHPNPFVYPPPAAAAATTTSPSSASPSKSPGWTDFNVISPTSVQRNGLHLSESPTFSPYRDTKAAASSSRQARRNGASASQPSHPMDDHELNPMEQSLIGISEFVALASVDDNSHNRRVIQSSGRYNWDRDLDTGKAAAYTTNRSTASSEEGNMTSSKLFQVKVLVDGQH